MTPPSTQVTLKVQVGPRLLTRSSNQFSLALPTQMEPETMELIQEKIAIPTRRSRISRARLPSISRIQPRIVLRKPFSADVQATGKTRTGTRLLLQDRNGPLPGSR